ncbi:MAG: polysaccharide export protein [Cycloclasticus sp.]|nr:polysaccharide export protein [Cycloclasticus sp.]
MKLSLVVCICVAAFCSSIVLADSLKHYRLGPGDQIKIQVTGEDELYVDVLISESGAISYPFLGDINVNNMTVSELDRFITDHLNGDYLIDPDVTVSVAMHRKFFVNGKVDKPGGFAFEPGMTVRKAISLAGGFDERANKKRIFVIRGGQDNAQPEPIALEGLVNPGDTITVERSFF